MATLLKINRRLWLALQAQKHRRARVLAARATLLPAPVLRAAYPDLLRWDWELPNPFKWNVWMSLDGGVSWILIEDYWMYGDARQFAPDGGSELHFIVGVDVDGNEVTYRSNSVRPDDGVLPPVPPAPVVTTFEVIDNNGQIDLNIAWTWDGLGWPDDGIFIVEIHADDTYDQGGGIMFLTSSVVTCPGRTQSLAGVCAAEDKGYYCRVVYKKGTTVGAYSALVYGNPY